MNSLSSDCLKLCTPPSLTKEGKAGEDFSPCTYRTKKFVAWLARAALLHAGVVTAGVAAAAAAATAAQTLLHPPSEQKRFEGCSQKLEV